MARTLSIPLLPQPVVSSKPAINLPSIFYDSFDVLNYKLYLDGINNASRSKVLFCGCIRNINPETFNKNLGKIFDVGSRFKDFHVLFIENDSEVWFKNHLKTLTGNDKVILSSKNYLYPNLGTGRDMRRVTIMAKLRNEYLRIIEKNFKDYEYVVVVDMDLTDWRTDGVFNSIGYKNWNMIGANGIQIKKDGQSITYYDTFALIESTGRVYPIQEFKDVLQLNSKREHVMACFGGIGIYRTKALLAGKEYTLYKMNNEYVSEQCGIHINMAYNGYGNISINPNMVVIR